MAYVEDPLKNTELDGEQQQAGQGMQGSEVQKTSGEGGTVGAGQQAQAAPQTAGAVSKRAPTSSGQFTNLQSYIKANKPAEFGKQVAGKVSGQAQQAQQALQKEQQGFQSQVDQQRAGFRDEQNIKSAFDTLRGLTGTGDIRQGFDAEKQAAEQSYQQQYTGPMQFENLSALSRQGRDLGTVAQQTQGDAGQRALLQRYYGSPQYSAGQQRLDQLLLTGDQSGELGKARQQAATFDPRLQKQSAQAQAQAQQTKQFADTGRELSRQLAEEGRTGELTELDELVGQRAKSYQDQVNKYKQDLAYNKAAKQYNLGSLNQLLGGGITNQMIAKNFGKAKDLATISRENADPAQAALANYFSRLTGADDVVQNIAEATPRAEDVTYYVDPQVSDIERQAGFLSGQMSDAAKNYYAIKAQHDAERDASITAQLGPDWKSGKTKWGTPVSQQQALSKQHVNWQTGEKVGASEKQLYSLEDQLRNLREKVGAGYMGGSGFY